MKEYLILTATFTVPFAVLGLLNLPIRRIWPIRHIRNNPNQGVK